MDVEKQHIKIRRTWIIILCIQIIFLGYMIFIGTQLTHSPLNSSDSEVIEKNWLFDSALQKFLIINIIVFMTIFFLLPKMKKIVLSSKKLIDFIASIFPVKSDDVVFRYKLYIDIALMMLMVAAMLPVILFTISGDTNILLIFIAVWIFSVVSHRPKISELKKLSEMQMKVEQDKGVSVSSNQTKLPVCPVCEMRQPWLTILVNIQLGLTFRLPKWECDQCKSKLSLTYKGVVVLWFIAFPIVFALIWGLIHIIQEIPVSEGLIFISHFISIGIMLSAIPLLIIIARYLGAFKIVADQAE